MRTNGRTFNEDKIRSSIKDNNNTRTRIAFRCIANYFASILTHGINSDITKDNLSIISEVRSILDEEKNILTYLNGILDDVNESALNSLLDRLYSIHNRSMSYYFKYISLIERSHRGDTISLDKNFISINDNNNNIRRDALSLSSSLDDILAWLDYPSEFIKYVKERIVIHPLPANFDEDYSKYTSILRLNHGNDGIVDIRLHLPEIVDFNSTLRCIELLEEAYSIYCDIKKLDKEVFDGVSLKKSYTEDLDNLGNITFGSR